MENKQDKRTRVIATVGVMAALGVVLAYLVRFPIFPQAPYLEYDAADIPILIVGFAFGPFWGLLITFIVAALQAMTVSAQSGIIGFVMHFLSTGL
ncbi:MAG: ECF transporter S component, partial [Clostridiales bacterium]|nr:ECF transporter S component [Clostridiales bacterium]